MSDNQNDDGLSTLKKMKTEVQRQQKAITPGTTKKGSKLSQYIPAVVKESLGGVSRKQWIDVTLFVGGIYCMYKFGQVASDSIDNFMPNEEQMQKMMQEMQVQQQA